MHVIKLFILIYIALPPSSSTLSIPPRVLFSFSSPIFLAFPISPSEIGHIIQGLLHFSWLLFNTGHRFACYLPACNRPPLVSMSVTHQKRTNQLKPWVFFNPYYRMCGLLRNSCRKGDFLSFFFFHFRFEFWLHRVFVHPEPAGLPV